MNLDNITPGPWELDLNNRDGLYNIRRKGYDNRLVAENLFKEDAEFIIAARDMFHIKKEEERHERKDNTRGT